MPAAPMNRSVTLNRSVAIVLVLIAFTVIVGWQLNIPELKSLMSKDMVPMVANSAICLFCIGISLYLISLEESSRLRGYTRFFSAMAILLGTITLVEYIVDFNIGIDQYIYNQPSDISNHPGRMSILSALNFTLVGLCFFFEFRSPDWYKRFLIGQYAMFVVFFTTLYPFTGTIFGALHFSSHITTMAIPTATGFFLITIAYFVRHADHGWAVLLFSKSIAGVLLRRIIIPVALVYPVIAFLSLLGEKEGRALQFREIMLLWRGFLLISIAFAIVGIS